jgi:hypothetical protein
VRDREIGQPSNADIVLKQRSDRTAKTVQKLQTALHAKAKAEALFALCMGIDRSLCS